VAQETSSFPRQSANHVGLEDVTTQRAAGFTKRWKVSSDPPGGGRPWLARLCNRIIRSRRGTMVARMEACGGLHAHFSAPSTSVSRLQAPLSIRISQAAASKGCVFCILLRVSKEITRCGIEQVFLSLRKEVINVPHSYLMERFRGWKQLQCSFLWGSGRRSGCGWSPVPGHSPFHILAQVPIVESLRARFALSSRMRAGGAVRQQWFVLSLILDFQI